MKTIEIIGKNYFGSWNKSRVACRGIVVRDSLLLMSYEAGTGLWMIPGGGLEPGEAEEMEARERELLSAFFGRPFKRCAQDGARETM